MSSDRLDPEGGPRQARRAGATEQAGPKTWRRFIENLKPEGLREVAASSAKARSRTSERPLPDPPPILLPYHGILPNDRPDVFLAARGITLVGDVELGGEAFDLVGSIARGDVKPIRIGRRTNVQDAASSTSRRAALSRDRRVGSTIGHGVISTAAAIRAGAAVGIGARVIMARSWPRGH